MTDRLERAFAFRASQLQGKSGDLLLLPALHDSDRVSELTSHAPAAPPSESRSTPPP